MDKSLPALEALFLASGPKRIGGRKMGSHVRALLIQLIGFSRPDSLLAKVYLTHYNV